MLVKKLNMKNVQSLLTKFIFSTVALSAPLLNTSLDTKNLTRIIEQPTKLENAFNTNINIKEVIEQVIASTNIPQLTIDDVMVTDDGGCKIETGPDIIEYTLRNTRSTYGSIGNHTLKFSQNDYSLQLIYNQQYPSSIMGVRIYKDIVYLDNPSSLTVELTASGTTTYCKIIPNYMKLWRLKISSNGRDWTVVLSEKRDHIEPFSFSFDVSNKPEGYYYMVLEGWDKANNYMINVQKIFITRDKPIPPKNIDIVYK
jgi:hypothetical protein